MLCWRMAPRLLLLALLLPLAPPARAEIPQLCAVTLFGAAPEAGRDAAAEAHAALERDGCQPGDAIVVVGSGYRTPLLAREICRPSAPIHWAPLLEDPAETQLSCEYPGKPGPRATRR